MSHGGNISHDGSSPNPSFRHLNVTFVDALSGDYRLALTDTAAKGQGEDLSGALYYPFAYDALGLARTLPWHIGAMPATE